MFGLNCVIFGIKLLAILKNGFGLRSKNSLSKIASGYGILNLERLSYKPVPGVRKSGIPDGVDIPAPVRTSIRLNFEFIKSFIKSSIL